MVQADNDDTTCSLREAIVTLRRAVLRVRLDPRRAALHHKLWIGR
jgi:CSLREA domain-containing protein